MHVEATARKPGCARTLLAFGISAVKVMIARYEKEQKVVCGAAWVAPCRTAACTASMDGRLLRPPAPPPPSAPTAGPSLEPLVALIPLVLGVLVVRYALVILEAVRQSMETSPRLLLNEKEDEEAPPPRPPPRPPPQAPPPLPSKALGDEVSPPDEPDRPAHRSTHRKEAMRSRSRATPPMRGSNKRRPLRPPHDERAWSFSSPAQPPHSTRGPFAQRRLGPIPRDFVTTDAYEQWVRGGPHPEIRETEHSRRAGRRAEGEPLEPPMAVRLRRMLYEQQQQQQQQQQQGTGTGGGSPSGSGGGTEPWSRSHGELSERVLETLGLAEALCSGSKIRRSGIARRFMEPKRDS